MKLFRIHRLSAEEKAEIVEKDRKQYLAWLERIGS